MPAHMLLHVSLYVNAGKDIQGEAVRWEFSNFLEDYYDIYFLQNKIGGNEVENATCYRNIAYNLSLILEHPVSNDSLGTMKAFWTAACKDVCKVHSITKMQVVSFCKLQVRNDLE